MMRLTEVAMAYGFTPMSTRRVRVCGASLVCRVESTRCPVCAALDGDFRRLQVTDFADHDHVRVWRRKARMAAANVRPTLGLTLT